MADLAQNETGGEVTQPNMTLEEIKKMKRKEYNRRAYLKHRKERIENSREYYAAKAAEKEKNTEPAKPGRKRLDLNNID